ncbi:MAG: cupin domain-containing protein [Acidiferrobacterales bacterium]
MSESKIFVVSSEIEPIVVREGVQRRCLVWSDDTMIAEWSIDKGLEMLWHSHPDEQVGYVVKGRIELIIGEEKKVLEAGGAYYVPPNVPHGGRVLESSVTIDVYSPVREDFKP